MKAFMGSNIEELITSLAMAPVTVATSRSYAAVYNQHALQDKMQFLSNPLIC